MALTTVEAHAAAATHAHISVVAVAVKRTACPCDIDARYGIVLEVGSWTVSEIDGTEVDDACRKNAFPLNCSYLCPEPVLAK